MFRLLSNKIVRNYYKTSDKILEISPYNFKLDQICEKNVNHERTLYLLQDSLDKNILEGLEFSYSNLIDGIAD